LGQYLDISLYGLTDKTGLELINNIRSHDEDSYKNKIIPIFCYSQHDHLQKEAYKCGATNYFSKNILYNTQDTRFIFFEQTLQALTFLYLDATEQARRLDLFAEIQKKLDRSMVENSLILNGVLQLLSLKDLDRILEKEDLDKSLTEILGNDAVLELRKAKFHVEQKELLESQLEDIAGILSSNPALVPIVSVLKGIRLISRTFWTT